MRDVPDESFSKRYLANALVGIQLRQNEPVHPTYQKTISSFPKAA
jgi:hypothetical protein